MSLSLCLCQCFCSQHFPLQAYSVIGLLTGLKCLTFLALDQTKVSDFGMVVYLRSAPSSLNQLSLNQTAVTEATLAELPSSTPQLRLLSIKHTKVSIRSDERLLSIKHTKVSS